VICFLCKLYPVINSCIIGQQIREQGVAKTGVESGSCVGLRELREPGEDSKEIGESVGWYIVGGGSE
jgi:hypothetical protein